MESKGEEEQPLQQDERRKNANKPPYKLAYQYKNRRERSNSNGKSRLDEITCTMSLRSEDFRQPWFHRTATRSVANKLLIDKQVGTFLIRPSSQRGCYAMTWVQAPNDVRHNLIYGLMPGYSLSERPTSETEKHWTLSSLIEHTDFLVHPLISSTFVDKRGNLTPDGRYIRRSITRTSSEVVEKIVDNLEKNVGLLTTLAWSLSVVECGDSSWYSSNQCDIQQDQSLAAMAFTSNVEKRTYVRYCGKEYVAPELMPLKDSAAEVILEALKTNTTLECLSILGHDGEASMRMNFAANFTNREALILAEALSINTSLTTIDLSVNAIGDKGAVAIAQALMNNRKVKSIDLSSNFIGRDGLSALAKLLRVNRNIETLKVDKQLRWEGATRAIVLQSGGYERAVVSLIHSAVQRRAELNNLDPSPYHGYLSHNDVIKKLGGQPPGSYLFHLNANMANTLWVSFVTSELNRSASMSREGKYVIRSRVLYRVANGYSFYRTGVASRGGTGGEDKGDLMALTQGSSNRKKACASVASLRDCCLWRICGAEPALYRRCIQQASADIKERLSDIQALVPLWRMGKVNAQVGTAGNTVMGQDVYSHMQAVAQRNSGLLNKPVECIPLSPQSNSGDVVIAPKAERRPPPLVKE